MRPIKNFSEKINKDRHTKLYVKDVPEAFNIHVDSAGWLWIETSRSNKNIKNCMRINFRWESDTIQIHIIPVGMGLNHKKERFGKFNPTDLVTYDKFQLWICELIREYYSDLKN